MSDPSFDVVSQVNLPEVSNAVAQAQKEIAQRFDLKGTAAGLTLAGTELTLTANDDFGLKAVNDLLQGKLVKRGVPLKALDYGKPEPAAKGTVRQLVTIRQGIATEKAKEIVKAIKDSKLKVQAAIQAEQVRVTGKKKDDLQQVIALLREADFGIPLQFTNFRG
ncbi:MAG TPA: YajQ family cyclic di-GMP-binding protein [Thermoanaerobaculia bacterium]|nr:YajQ family cyclic di-GMP-binding protein [Thermoanaerobaculia bacterium]HQR67983.1 YajQ family cyclic di-GMP-binding protein [Thermoanaerobaculia bacterium]